MQINRLPTLRLLLHNTLHTAAHSLPSHWKVDWNGIINFYLYSTDFTDLGHIIKKKKVSYRYWQQHLQLPTVVALHPFVLFLTVIWNKALSLVLWLEKKGMQLLALFNSIPPTSWQGHGSCRRKLRLEAERREGVCRFQGQFGRPCPSLPLAVPSLFLWPAAFLDWCWKTVPVSPRCCFKNKENGVHWSPTDPKPQPQPQQPLELQLDPKMWPEPQSVPIPLLQSGQVEGSPKLFQGPVPSHQVLSVFPMFSSWGGKLGWEHPWHTAFVFPYTTCLSMGLVAILPLAEKPHQALSSGSVLVCPVVNTLLWIKHSLYYTLLLTLLWLLQFFSKLCFHLIMYPSVSSITRKEAGKRGSLSGFNFPTGF